MVPIGFWDGDGVLVPVLSLSVSLYMDSGSRADTLSVRFASQGVKNEVDSAGGEDTGVVNRIWTASFSHLTS